MQNLANQTTGIIFLIVFGTLLMVAFLYRMYRLCKYGEIVSASVIIKFNEYCELKWIQPLTRQAVTIEVHTVTDQQKRRYRWNQTVPVLVDRHNPNNFVLLPGWLASLIVHLA